MSGEGKSREPVRPGASSGVAVTTADQRAADLWPAITIGLTNTSGRVLAMGGLRCIAERKGGSRHTVSMPCLWAIEPDEYVSFPVVAGGDPLARIEALHSFEYVETDGTVTPVGGRVEFPAKFGFLGSPRVVAGG